MKIKRYKKVQRHINFYINNFDFRKPYQLLVDGTFCCYALNAKVNISTNIPTYLGGEVKLLTTPCVVIEMEKLGRKLSGALTILKQYYAHKCSHKLQPVTGAECLLSMVENKNENHYIIATQDRDLQDKIRSLPGVPLLYLYCKAPVLEEPSDVSRSFAKQNILGLMNSLKNALVNVNVKNDLPQEEEEVSKQPKKIKGPNPLSCKKKKKKSSTENTSEKVKIDNGGVQKKKRKRIKIPEHVKQELINNKVLT